MRASLDAWQLPSRLWTASATALAAVACVLLGAAGGVAAEFPPVTEAERTLTSVSGEPNARAVVLFRNGDLNMPDPRGELVTSVLTVKMREKILTQQGLDKGTMRIYHGSFTRLHDLTGRTVLPDGTVVPLPTDAVVTTAASRAQHRFVTVVAFPRVQVGAILDLQYQLYWDDFTLLEPWYFSYDVPVVHSEILYHLPAGVRMGIWGFGPYIDKVKTEPGSDVRGRTFRVTADNLPSLPAEPYSLPSYDFSPRMMLVPHSVNVGGMPVKLLENWPSTCALYKQVYQDALGDDSDVKRMARSLLTAEDRSAADKAAKLFRWVRDTVRTDPGQELTPEKAVTVDKVLNRRHGTSNEKALLLVAMLHAVDVPAHLVWAADRWDGQIDEHVATPAWFSRTLVAAEVEGGRVVVDPADPDAAFAHIGPGFEGMPAILYDYKKPEVITLPESSAADNRREVHIDLTVGTNGTASGRGTLTLTGQHGWERIGWKDSPEQTAAAWKGWLENRLKSYVISNVTVSELREASRVEVTWRMELADPDDADGELLVNAAAPFGSFSIAPSLPQTGRRTPVAFAYPDRDDVEWHLAWPDGWVLEATPAAQTQRGGAGAFEVSYKVDTTARTLIAERRLDIVRRITTQMTDYEELRQLLLEAQRADAQTIVLRRR